MFPSVDTRLLRETAAGDQCFIISCCCRASSPCSDCLRLLYFPSPHQYCSIVPKEAVIREGNMERITEQCNLQEKCFQSILFGQQELLYLLSEQCISLETCGQIIMNLHSRCQTHTVSDVSEGSPGVFGFGFNVSDSLYIRLLT